MRHIALRTKLIFSFSLVIVVGVFLSVIIGIRLIGNTIIKQAHDKVRLDLNSAREVYHEESQCIKNIVRLTAIRFFVRDAVLTGNREMLRAELRAIMERESLDILTLVDKKGCVLVRARNPMSYGDQLNDEVVNWVMSKKQAVVSTQIVPQEELLKESEDLAQQVRLELIPTPRARPSTKAVETSGMMIKAAAPIFDNKGNLIGVLYGGKLLNRNYEIVDKVKDIVYRGEKYKGKDIGTVTIFQGDLRISTNVRRSDGSRAIGTRVSEEVYNQVIGKGIPWIGRAFVVNNWYITAYEPIKNLKGDIIGMLYVGMLEAPYIDLRNKVIFTFLGVAIVSVILLSIVGYLITSNIVKPLKELLDATKKVAGGDLAHRVQIKSRDEIGQLARSFNHMTMELQKATENYLMLNRTLEDKVREKSRKLKEAQEQLIQSEKLTSLGKMAAGVAHEINNPLTSILINTHLIAEKLKDDGRFQKNLNLIIDETTRCSEIVKGLLEFSRQTPPKKTPADINEVIEKTLLLLRSQLLVHNVKVAKDLDGDLPKIMIDINKIEQVFTNIVLNAIEAMPDGGMLFVSSRISADSRFVEIEFRDEGVGIPKENINRIFDPFFTTKGTKGTGLGLSVSYGIVQQHRGTIDVQSELGKGTSVTIHLPINEAKKPKSKD